MTDAAPFTDEELNERRELAGVVGVEFARVLATIDTLKARAEKAETELAAVTKERDALAMYFYLSDNKNGHYYSSWQADLAFQGDVGGTPEHLYTSQGEAILLRGKKLWEERFAEHKREREKGG